MGKIPRQKTPRIIDKSVGYIGESPSATYCGEPLLNSFQYLNNYAQNGQIFTYSGPPDDALNDAPGQDGTFYVILQGSDKADTANAARQLGGALLPWRYDAEQLTTDWSGEVSISWEHDAAAADVHYRQNVSTLSGSDNYFNDLTEWNSPIPLKGPNFKYTPAADYSVGELVTSGIQTAALGIWTMPDEKLEADQAVFYSDEAHAFIAADRAIRGYTGTGEPSLGTLIHLVGDTARNDDLLWNTQRCLFQWGHPLGVYTASSSYVEMCTDARYALRPQNYREQAYPSEYVTLHPNIVATSVGADVGNKAYVRLRIFDSTPALIDTWTVEFYDNAPTLYKYSDGSGADGISTIPHEASFLKVEMQAPTSGELILHTIAIWQAPEW